jgi:hypothetical protein
MIVCLPDSMFQSKILTPSEAFGEAYGESSSSGGGGSARADTPRSSRTQHQV